MKAEGSQCSIWKQNKHLHYVVPEHEHNTRKEMRWETLLITAMPARSFCPSSHSSGQTSSLQSTRVAYSDHSSLYVVLEVPSQLTMGQTEQSLTCSIMEKPHTACGHRMAHRKWKQTKQKPSLLPGPAVPGCSSVYFHFLWAILCPQAVVTVWDRDLRWAKAIFNILRRNRKFPC